MVVQIYIFLIFPRSTKLLQHRDLPQSEYPSHCDSPLGCRGLSWTTLITYWCLWQIISILVLHSLKRYPVQLFHGKYEDFGTLKEIINKRNCYVLPQLQACLAWNIKWNLIIIVLFFHLERACRICPCLWLRTLLARLKVKKRSVFIGTTSSKFVFCICYISQGFKQYSIFNIHSFKTLRNCIRDFSWHLLKLILWFSFMTRRKSSFTW